MSKNIFFLIFLILLLPIASAQFLAFGDTAIDAHPCDVLTKNITIQNTKTEAHNYEISVGGEGADFVTFSEISFTLAPQQSKTITAFYNIPCDAELKPYATEIYFYDGEDELALEQDLLAQLPSTISVEAVPTSQVIPPCGTASYNLTLNNPSNITEVYNLRGEGHPNVVLSPEIIILLANQSKEAKVTVAPEDCTQSGTFPLNIEISTEKSEQTENAALELIITPTGIPVLAKDTKKIKTIYEDRTAELSIQNIGDAATTYSLTLEGPEWATIEPKTLTLEATETGTINLRLNPGEDAQSKNYEVTLTATVDKTGVEYEKVLTVALSRPGFIDKHPTIFIAIILTIVLLILIITFLIFYFRSESFKNKRKLWREKRELKRKEAETRRKERMQRRAEARKRREEERRKKKEEKLERKNEGRSKKENIVKKKDELRKADENKAAELEKQKQRTEERKSRIKLQIEKELRKKYHLVSKEETIHGKRKRGMKNFFILIFCLLLLVIGAAFWKYIKPNLVYAGIGVMALLVMFALKKIMRTTTINARVKLLVSGDAKSIAAWRKGLVQLEVETEQPTRNYNVRITKRSTRNSPAPATYHVFTVEQNESAKMQAAFKVSKKWLARKEIEPEELKLGRMSNYSWRSIPVSLKGEDQKNVYYTAEIKEGTYALYGKPKPKPVPKKEPRSKKSIVITGMVLIALLAAFAITLINPSTVSGAIPSQVWKQDTVHKLELVNYFQDPDGDMLTYRATPTAHVTIDFINNTALLTPDEGFVGEEMVKFIATDKQGAAVTSNSVPLRVKKTVLPASLQPLAGIVLGLFAVLVLFWMAYNLKKK